MALIDVKDRPARRLFQGARFRMREWLAGEHALTQRMAGAAFAIRVTSAGIMVEVQSLLTPDARERRSVVDVREAVQTAEPVTIEVASGGRLSEIDADWHDLMSRTDAPNVFMNPALTTTRSISSSAMF
jgi:hypothetical protein